LKGRFLHVTDIHPDPHYNPGSKVSDGCHKKQKHKGKSTKEQLAGDWGTPVTECDSPMSLVKMTFEWLKKEWADEVDFVVWTGDNARHDIDRDIPRRPDEIYELNRLMVDLMRDAFPPHVHIVPSIGNNDIYPHNVLAAGPSSISSEYGRYVLYPSNLLLTEHRIWKPFIPSDYRHVFERGMYFSAEVIPDQLAVISLNTLFWYDSNTPYSTVVDGCVDRSSDPGALEMDWLEVQLEELRDREMQVWLTGHVPPHAGNYFETCYLRYGDLALRYQDTIVGHLFGHMNVDHFFFLDVIELEDGAFGTFGRSANNGLRDELKKDFGEMPGPQAIKLKDYVVVNVGASVIPTYLPGVRVYSYNISGLDDEITIAKKRKHGHRHDKPKDDCSLPEHQDKPHCTFKHKPRYYNKTSPSRSNRPLTPLGYTQFYLPDMDQNKNHQPEWKIEYTTHRVEHLIPSNTSMNLQLQPPPIPLHLLPESFEKALKKITPWKMKDLTIGSYVKLARKLIADKKMWKQFQNFM
ncbi:hypothetical protein TREMEDRAFT_27201, partial [Tremella mesenterica DSM 1558]|uniref:uncharacterized protein n=1 Tax=Tremella mesenterica (strain ATCC 24925 / CBS 8224 / DSM 1558 / NBRC 9311 / NRRL Y-6157 / RJB 2259-6 / UBC 559-6) TaxID=578456 RepID=UPI0003F49139